MADTKIVVIHKLTFHDHTPLSAVKELELLTFDSGHITSGPVLAAFAVEHKLPESTPALQVAQALHDATTFRIDVRDGKEYSWKQIKAVAAKNGLTDPRTSLTVLFDLLRLEATKRE